MDEYLKLTIAKSGELVYNLFALADKEESKTLPESMNLKSANKIMKYELSWRVADSGTPSPSLDDTKLCQYKEVEEIPVVSIRGFIASSDFIIEITQFINDAKKLRNEKVVVLDLRQNIGGDPTIGNIWLYNLTEKIIGSKSEQIVRSNDLSNYGPNPIKRKKTSSIKYMTLTLRRNILRHIIRN